MGSSDSDQELVIAHYAHNWGADFQLKRWKAGPVYELGPQFSTIVFPKRKTRQAWTYATVGMSYNDSSRTPYGIEVYLLAPTESDAHVELLTTIAHYHKTGRPLDLGHSVNFGRPWYPGSRCTHGLLSLPYLDGPTLEWLSLSERDIRFCWLIPITGAERNFLIESGLDLLETHFERAKFNYLDPGRGSVV